MKRTLIVFLSVLSLLASPLSWASSTAVMAVIAQHDLQHRHLSKADISLIFWRKKLFWANGERIQPVNLPANHPLREQFSTSVMGASPDSQTDYWNELYYHGVRPPHVVLSPEAVIRFVSDTVGAVGYINACQVDSRVKVVAWVDSDGTFLNQSPSLDCEHQHQP